VFSIQEYDKDNSQDDSSVTGLEINCHITENRAEGSLKENGEGTTVSVFHVYIAREKKIR
jgi:hypothetical protein